MYIYVYIYIYVIKRLDKGDISNNMIWLRMGVDRLTPCVAGCHEKE